MPLFAKFPLNAAGGDASGDGPMDLLSDTLKATLHNSTYTPNQSTNETKSDATNELSTGSGYTSGGITLSSKTYTSSSLVTTFDCADLTWAAISVAHRHLVFWDDTPTAPADPLVAYYSNGADVNPGGNDLVYTINASGLFAFTVT